MGGTERAASMELLAGQEGPAPASVLRRRVTGDGAYLELPSVSTCNRCNAMQKTSSSSWPSALQRNASHS